MSLVSQGVSAQEGDTGKSVSSAVTEHVCLLLGSTVCQARQGPYFHNTLKLEKKDQQIIKETRRSSESGRYNEESLNRMT